MGANGTRTGESGALFFSLTFQQMYARARELPIPRPLRAREEPPHAGAVLIGLGQLLDPVVLERDDNLRHHVVAHMVTRDRARGGERKPAELLARWYSACPRLHEQRIQ